jgi:hypothetical protein
MPPPRAQNQPRQTSLRTLILLAIFYRIMALLIRVMFIWALLSLIKYCVDNLPRYEVESVMDEVMDEWINITAGQQLLKLGADRQRSLVL